MRKITLFWLLSFWLFLSSAFSQNIENQYKRIGTAQATSLSLDILGNIYLLNGNTIYKLSSSGEVVASYTNFKLGEITSVDVDNPLKIMLFYKDAGAIVFLDSQMTPLMETIDLLENHYYSISLATFSSDDLIWLYDNRAKELIAVDFFLKEKRRISIDNELSSPAALLAIPEKSLFLHDPATGILMFDAFGTYLKTITLITQSKIQISDNQVVYIDQDELFLYDFQELRQSWLAYLPAGVLQAVLWNNQVLFIGSDKNVYSFPIE